MDDLTDRQLVCLEVMVGDDMLGVGPWKDLLDGLVELGYAMPLTDGQHYRLTDAGLAALKEESDATDA